MTHRSLFVLALGAACATNSSASRPTTVSCRAPPTDPVAVLPLERIGDRGFVVISDVTPDAPADGWSHVANVGMFFDGTSTALESAPAASIDRTLTVTLVRSDGERELTTDRWILLRLHRSGGFEPGKPVDKVERVVLAAEVDLAGVPTDDDGARFVFTGTRAGRRLFAREWLPFDGTANRDDDAWLAGAGFERNGEFIQHSGFAGTDLEELHTVERGERLMVFRRGAKTVDVLRGSPYAFAVGQADQLWLVVEDGSSSGVVGHGITRRYKLRPVR